MVRSLCFLVAILVAMLEAAPAHATPEVTPPRRLDETTVPYPPGAHGDAEVTLKLVVDATGAVKEVTVTRGQEPFASAAVAAIQGWRFAPATRDGDSIPARIAASVTFHEPRVSPAPAPRSAPAPPSPPRPARPSEGGTRRAPEPPADVVSVHGEREEPGTIHIPGTDTRLVPGAFGDPFRAIEALPGVGPWLSGLPYYYVRGSPPESVGYAIDGIPVPLLFHVGSGPSVLAPDLVDSVDLYPGSYPARYGRYAGAMITGETTEPEMDRPRAAFGVRVFDASAFGEVPYDGGQGSVLVAARYSYTQLVTSLILHNYTVGYWDYQARVSHRVFGRDTVSLFVFGSYDELTYKKQPTFRVEYHRADLRYDHPVPGGNLRLAATFRTDDTLTAVQTSTGAGASAALRGPGGRIRAELDQRVGAHLRLRAGADAAVTRFDEDAFDTTVRSAHTDLEGGLYADAVWRPTRTLEIVPGARLDAYRTSRDTPVAPQPRLAGTLRITPALSWITALGTAHQEPTEEVFVPAKLPSNLAESSRTSFQYSEAFEARLPSSVRARATGYYERVIAPSIGEERSVGLELFLRRDFTERLGGFVSYTLSRTDAAIGPQALGRSGADRTHLLSLVAGYDFGGGWRAGARFFFESGRTYTVRCPTPSCAPGPQGSGAYVVTGDLPPFYRLDARIERRWSFASGQWLALTLECFNALGAAEPTSAAYSSDAGLTIERQSPIVLPSFGVEGGL
jgi:TonB family protein